MYVGPGRQLLGTATTAGGGAAVVFGEAAVVGADVLAVVPGAADVCAAAVVELGAGVVVDLPLELHAASTVIAEAIATAAARDLPERIRGAYEISRSLLERARPGTPARRPRRAGARL